MGNTIYGEIADHLTARANRERMEAACGDQCRPLFTAVCETLAARG